MVARRPPSDLRARRWLVVQDRHLRDEPQWHRGHERDRDYRCQQLPGQLGADCERALSPGRADHTVGAALVSKGGFGTTCPY